MITNDLFLVLDNEVEGCNMLLVTLLLTFSSHNRLTKARSCYRNL